MEKAEKGNIKSRAKTDFHKSLRQAKLAGGTVGQLGMKDAGEAICCRPPLEVLSVFRRSDAS